MTSLRLPLMFHETSTLTLLGFRTLSDRVTRSSWSERKTTVYCPTEQTREAWKIDKSKTHPKMYHNLDTKSPQTRRSHALNFTPPTKKRIKAKAKLPSCAPHKTSPKSSPLTCTLKIQYFPPTPFAITSYASPPHTSPSPPSTPPQAAASPSHTRAQSTKRPWHPCMETPLAYLPCRTQGRRCVPAVGERRARRRL